MDDLLEDLSRVRGVGGCLVLSQDGLTIASQLRHHIDEDELSAAVADLISRCDRFNEVGEITDKADTTTFTTISGSEGSLAITSAGNGYLALLIDPSANSALLRLDIQPFITALSERLTM